MGIAVYWRNYWTGEGRFSIDELFDAAIGRETVYADKHLVVARTMEPVGLCFSGEIDVTNSHAVAESLDLAFSKADDIHLDLSRLSFCDISGIRSLVDAAEARATGRLMLHGLPELLQTVMKVTGWSEMPNLYICNCGAKT
ncbi:MAG: STAS domain-containing protein [Candidatus Dormibacteraeota bacterium]|nr:STAS domain-containing protein [Candidatus Dormibacteraeota bacterium]